VKFGWIDLRSVPEAQRQVVVDAAVHARIDGILDDRTDHLATLPPTVRRVLVRDHVMPGAEENGVDIVAVPVSDASQLDALRQYTADGGDTGLVAYVDVVDERTLELACTAATELADTIVKFRDPTKIPLEIVIAAADKSAGRIICEAGDLDEAAVIQDVLEKGSDGLLFRPRHAGDVFALDRLLRTETPALSLSKLTVTGIEHSGLGHRVCVDTCTHFEKDEGILVGSYAHGFILCASETHPLPYMPTRPFRVNAGALHSYVLGQDNRTNYLSELHAGSTVLAVGADGRTRRVVVGRSKLEARPLLTIRATAEDGTEISLCVQDDWHVRVLGPGGAVLNVTELKQGDQVLGYLATDRRHVGWPVEEFCVET
jgi:3-amino-4-hydroxybenzoic acid synthase